MSRYKRDVIYLAIVAAVILAVCLIGSRLFSHGGDRVRIEINGKQLGEYLLSEDQTIYLPDRSGYTNTLTISEGKAYMSEANCPDKLCMHQGAIFRSGQTIVCLPNKIVVTVVSEHNSDEIDTVVK